jgi:hypothetical protein
VTLQQIIDPITTIATPCQKLPVKATPKIIEAKRVEKMGVK